MNFGVHGANTFYGEHSAAREISVSGEDLLRHLYIIGGTGSGKTNLLKHLMRQSQAFCLIDKEGDLAREIADAMPCIYFRAADFAFPVGLNPLINVPTDDRSRVTADIVELFSDIWGLGDETPRLIYYLRASLRLLLDNTGTTLLDIRRVLSDDIYRARLLRKSTDRAANQTWKEFDAKDPKQQAIEISSLQNKAAALASSLPLQLILGQHTSTVDFQRAMRDGQTIVCDLSGIGDEPARLLGAVVIFLVANTAYNRTGSDREPYTLIVDEFEDFATRTMPGLLSKARKRGLSLSLAHQYISQLPDDIAEAILANCGTLVSFRVGVNDAPIIGKAMDAPEDELRNLGQGRAWIAPLQRGMRGQALPIAIPLTRLKTGHLARNIKTTRHSYARPRPEVEARFDLEEWKARKAAERAQMRAAEREAAEELEKDKRMVQRRKRRKTLLEAS